VPATQPAAAPIASAVASIRQWTGSIAAPHPRHRPRCASALMSGTSSSGDSTRPHASQAERPRITDRSSVHRTTSAATKLPMIAPRTASATAQFRG